MGVAAIDGFGLPVLVATLLAIAFAIFSKKEAEARGIAKILDAKAKGYERLMAYCGRDSRLLPTLLVVEKMDRLVAEQVKAIKDLKIDKITVWDGGRGGVDGPGGTAGFLSGLMGSLPPMHELARSAGIDLPRYLGTIDEAEPEEDGEEVATVAEVGAKPEAADEPSRN